ncbi:MAG TPA: fluoride efflux transporter CrcB [Pirellulales bacterium]|jgi:CrcB protein
MKWIFIACGGAFGSLARYWMQGTVYSLTGWAFPLGTVSVNLLGCLLIGILYAMFSGPFPVRDEIRLGLIVGVLGGFTTFSAFSLETFLMAQEGKMALALLNVVLSCVLGLVAVWCGFRLAGYYFGVPTMTQ